MNLKIAKNTIILTAFLSSCVQFLYADTVTTNKTSDTAIQNSILIHINEYRQQHHLPKLKMNNFIVKEAKQHSIDMANHSMPFGHKHFSQRIKKLYAQINNANAGAENVAYNYKDASDVVKNWLRSPGHKRNIDGHYNLTGIGVARDQKGKLYFTQIFVRTELRNKGRVRNNFLF
ncbi:MAG: CAP domain-containing protein [Legionellales bacterium]